MSSAPDRIDGINLSLRLVEPADAGFIHGLRTNPTLNAHLSPVTGSTEDQRAWIERYKAREAAGQEHYFIIERRDGPPCGTVRIYDIQSDSFVWGSWILTSNMPPKAALESVVLSLQFGFAHIGRQVALITARKGNHRALSFYRKFGMVQVDEEGCDVHFTYAGHSS